jgi:60 kDa SS-A/Ro ribonucleoprotein
VRQKEITVKTVYASVFEDAREEQKGLTTTHQGGQAYAIDAWKQFRRFLILGSDRPTFYANAKKLTDLNIKAVKEVLDLDGLRAVQEIVDVSNRALAPSNEPAIVALSMAASYTNTSKPEYAANVRKCALSALPKVARIGTHLFHFADYVDKQRGWGSSLRKGIANWYLQKSPMALANQVTKYQQRDGWSHADLLRLSHPKATDATRNAIFKYVVDGELPQESDDRSIVYLSAVEEIQKADEQYAIRLIQEFNLPREVVPTEHLRSAKVWEALLLSGDSGMPFTAMLRNLATMSKVGLLTQGSNAASFVINQLHNEEAIRNARIHPIDVLKAKLTYETGHGVRSDAAWIPVVSVVENLEDAFYLSFGNVTPTGKRILMALDISGSMTFGERSGYGAFGSYYSSSYGDHLGLAGVPGLSPRIAATVLAMVTARVERDFEILGFSHQLVNLGISKHDSLSTAMAKAQRDFGGTDCSLPFTYAMQNNKNFDAFCVYTDSETGGQNPSKVLKQYRQKSGIDAKLVVNGMTVDKFSIADPTDGGMLDCVGFDSSTPQVQSAFIRGEI